MDHMLRDILAFAIAACAVTLAASGWAWWNEESRRLWRALDRALAGRPDASVVSHGRGAALDLGAGLVAVVSDGGRRLLVYELQHFVGAELLVDGRVAARAFRGEDRRALDQVADDAREVALRLIFDDARDPDFEVWLWRGGDVVGRDGSPHLAIQEARRWLARAEAILRRSGPLAQTK